MAEVKVFARLVTLSDVGFGPKTEFAHNGAMTLRLMRVSWYSTRAGTTEWTVRR